MLLVGSLGGDREGAFSKVFAILFEAAGLCPGRAGFDGPLSQQSPNARSNDPIRHESLIDQPAHRHRRPPALARRSFSSNRRFATPIGAPQLDMELVATT
jgi:hypothetical protein